MARSLRIPTQIMVEIQPNGLDLASECAENVPSRLNVIQLSDTYAQAVHCIIFLGVGGGAATCPGPSCQVDDDVLLSVGEGLGRIVAPEDKVITHIA
jgi:hypothetical protein